MHLSTLPSLICYLKLFYNFFNNLSISAFPSKYVKYVLLSNIIHISTIELNFYTFFCDFSTKLSMPKKEGKRYVITFPFFFLLSKKIYSNYAHNSLLTLFIKHFPVLNVKTCTFNQTFSKKIIHEYIQPHIHFFILNIIKIYHRHNILPLP